MTDFLCTPVRLSNGTFVNNDVVRFSIVPGNRRLSVPRQHVLDCLDAYSSAEKAEDFHEPIDELLRLHKERKLLWPLGAVFHHSCIGTISGYMLANRFRRSHPSHVSLVESASKSRFMKQGQYPAYLARQIISYAGRILTAIELSTTKEIKTVADLGMEDVERIASIARQDNAWADWANLSIRKGLIYSSGIVSQDGDLSTARSSKRRFNPTYKSKRLIRAVDQYKYKWLKDLYEQWLDTRKTLTKKTARIGLYLLSDFIECNYPEGVDRDELLSRASVLELIAFAETWRTGNTRALAAGKLSEFAEWIRRQREFGSDVDEFMFFRRDYDSIVKSIPPRAGPRRGEVAARPMPPALAKRLFEMITENDFAWPKSLRDHSDDQLKYYTRYVDPESGMVEHIFCPVIPRILLLMLQIPPRGIQVRRLDSGEGDDRMWDPVTEKWKANPGRHAKYWSRRHASNAERGAIREIRLTNGRSMAIFWINSNKNADQASLFGEESGFEIPWENKEALQNIAAMREWQERFNPVDGPLAHEDLPRGIFADEPSEAVKPFLPDRFYLFRDPTNPGALGRQAPPSSPRVRQFFLEALAELERRMNAENPDAPVVLITKWIGPLPTQAIYDPHGLRSTFVIGQAQVGTPLEAIRRATGQKTIAALMQYAKTGPVHTSDLLTEGARRAAIDGAAAFHTVLASAALEDQMRMTARLADDGLRQIGAAGGGVGTWDRMDIGLCPNGGALCDVGGRCVSKRVVGGVDNSKYSPVPGGRNCVRCRFFVTGLPYLIPLFLHINKILLRLDNIDRRAKVLEAQDAKLKIERNSALSEGKAQSADNKDRIAKITPALNAVVRERHEVFQDLNSTMVLFEKVRALADRQGEQFDETKIPMLVPSDSMPEIVLQETSRFELVHLLVQGAELFESVSSPELELELRYNLDRLMFTVGEMPLSLADLPPDLARKSAISLATMLIRLAGSEGTSELMEGRTTMEALGVSESFIAACRRSVSPVAGHAGRTLLAPGS